MSVDTQPFDFRRPMILSREHVRTLAIIQESMARGFTTALALALRAAVAVEVKGIEQRPYGEYVRDLPNPALLTTISIDPVAGGVLLNLPLTSAFVAAELLLGGSGGGEQPERAMTEIELRLIRTVTDTLLPWIRHGLEPIAMVEPAVVSQESNPQFAQFIASTDTVVVIGFELTIEDVTEEMTLCIPFASIHARLDEISARASMGNAVDVAHEQEALRQAVALAPVTSSVVFRPSVVTPSQLADLHVGDLLLLGHPVDMPLTFHTGGVATHEVRIGRVSRRYAAEIVADADPQVRRRPVRVVVQSETDDAERVA